ncbi:MAG TPA: hypothetical protein ENJ24_01845 [Gammaproteobacteria bacterium]|nr:hypothetical protein [Gammaproteobacteria bacterium]
MKAEDILSRLTTQLKDPTGVRWNEIDLLEYITDGQRQVCLLVPKAYMVIESVKLAAGTEQTVPAGSSQFGAALVNMGSDGDTRGPAINESEFSDMNRFNPGWQTDPTSTVVTDFMFEYDNPLTYWVYPPVPSTPDVWIKIRTPKIPAVVTSPGALMNVNDLYLTPIYEYCMYRALSKDAQTKNTIEAENHRQRFFNALGLKVEADKGHRQRQRGGDE